MIFVLILPNLFFFHQLIILPIHLKYDLSEAFVKYERFKLNKSNNKTSYQRHEKRTFKSDVRFIIASIWIEHF